MKQSHGHINQILICGISSAAVKTVFCYTLSTIITTTSTTL